MGHVAQVEETNVDPRPFVPPEEAGIQHQAVCTECDWKGPVRLDTQNGRHDAAKDAEEHELAT